MEAHEESQLVHQSLQIAGGRDLQAEVVWSALKACRDIHGETIPIPMVMEAALGEWDLLE